MSEIDVADILKLPARERLHLIELIWESLVRSPSELPLGDAHCAIIDERLAEHERDPCAVATRDEVFAEARRGR